MSVLPESKAAERIAEIVGQHFDPRWITAECLKYVGSKVVANREAVVQVLAELDADSSRVKDRDVLLSQQHTNDVESVVWWEEHAGHLKRELDDALRILERVKAGTMADYNPDERGADEDQDRWSREIADEKATNGAPRLAG